MFGHCSNYHRIVVALGVGLPKCLMKKEMKRTEFIILSLSCRGPLSHFRYQYEKEKSSLRDLCVHTWCTTPRFMLPLNPG